MVSWVTSSGFATLATTAGATPWARPERYGVRRVDGVVFGPEPEHRLDVYVPSGPGPHPVAIYFHGGGFRALSRETHWLFGIKLAQAGFVTFLPDYRLAPTHPFPAAAQDACRGTRWVWDHAADFGGDVEREFLLTGESAGANLSVVASLAACTDRHEPWARPLRGVRPTKLIPFCGLLQTTEPERYRGTCPAFIQDIIDHTCWQYATTGSQPLADPVNTLEQLDNLGEWPQTFVPWGGGDPIAEDSARLVSALQRLGAPVRGKSYGTAGHAFHAYVWQQASKDCWRDVDAFLAGAFLAGT